MKNLKRYEIKSSLTKLIGKGSSVFISSGPYAGYILVESIREPLMGIDCHRYANMATGDSQWHCH